MQPLPHIFTGPPPSFKPFLTPPFTAGPRRNALQLLLLHPRHKAPIVGPGRSPLLSNGFPAAQPLGKTAATAGGKPGRMVYGFPETVLRGALSEAKALP